MGDVNVVRNYFNSNERRLTGRFMFEARREPSHKVVLQKMVDTIAAALNAERVAFYALDKMNLLCIKTANRPEVLIDSHVKDIPPEGPMATVIEKQCYIYIPSILRPSEQYMLDSNGHFQPIKGNPLDPEVTADYIGKFGANFGRSGEQMSVVFGCLSLHDKTFGVFKADAFSSGRSIKPNGMTEEELLFNVAVISNLASHSLDELSTRMELLQAKKKLENQNVIVTQLLMKVLHAFKGRLTVPRSYLEMAMKLIAKIPGVRARRWLEKPLAMLVKAMQSFDQISLYMEEYLRPLKSGSLELKIDRKPVKVRELFEDLAMAQLEVENGLMEATIIADKEKVRDIVLGLIENAEKYDGKGKPIIVGCKAVGDKLEVSVKDQGIGLLPRQRQIIFEGNVRLQPEKEGEGQGLAGFKLMVEEMGGSIRAESEGYQKGSTFIFTLPIV